MKLTINNINCQISEVSSKEINYLRMQFFTFAPNYRFNKLFKLGKWNGKVNIISEMGEFPTGILPDVLLKLNSYKLVDNRFIKNISTIPSGMSLRDYQIEAIKKCIQNKFANTWWPRGILQAACGAGKTEIATAMIKMTKVPTIFITDSRDLVNQTIERFKKYGLHANEDLDSDVVCTTVQSLMSWAHKTNKTSKRTDDIFNKIKVNKFEREKIVIEKLKKFEQVFIDEAHGIAATGIEQGNMFVQALSLLPNAYMRWGLTATPFMREEYHNLLLQGSTGEVLFKITGKQLVDAGYLAKPNITMYRCSILNIPNKWPLVYDLGIVNNSERNNKIVSEIEKLEGPTMVLVKSLAHGDLLEQLCKKKGISTRFLSGECSNEERQEAINDLVSGKIKCAIGSKIWQTGIDVKEIKTLINAAGGKSQVAILQKLGRGLRVTEGKTSVNVVDFLDTTSKWLKEHSRNRKNTYLEQGYEVNEQSI